MDERDRPTEAKKKPYDPPRILSREPLEAVAAVCSTPGKANPGACPSGPIQS
jgi:hypothetical protein